MKKATSLAALGVIAIVGIIFFLQWTSEKDISCEVKEDLRSSPQVVAVTTKTLDLHVIANKSTHKELHSELVKDVKIQLSMNAASLNVIKIFGFQISVPAWQINQIYEDLSSGIMATNYSISPKILSDFRSWNLATYTRKNGDWIGLSCFPKK